MGECPCPEAQVPPPKMMLPASERRCGACAWCARSPRVHGQSLPRDCGGSRPAAPRGVAGAPAARGVVGSAGAAVMKASNSRSMVQKFEDRSHQTSQQTLHTKLLIVRQRSGAIAPICKKQHRERRHVKLWVCASVINVSKGHILKVNRGVHALDRAFR